MRSGGHSRKDRKIAALGTVSPAPSLLSRIQSLDEVSKKEGTGCVRNAVREGKKKW